MLCSRCNKNEATVFINQIVNNQVTQLHLCASCAQDPKTLTPLGPPIFDLLSGFGAWRTPLEKHRVLECRSCGMKYTEFRETGYLGCPECYANFSQPLRDVLKHIHGSLRHTGKAPPVIPATDKDKKRLGEEIARLRQQLKNAISDEKFEEAARLRDRLRSLENSLG